MPAMYRFQAIGPQGQTIDLLVVANNGFAAQAKAYQKLEADGYDTDKWTVCNTTR
jgi:hypothetical protein